VTADLWKAVDDYISKTLVKPDVALDSALVAISAAHMPSISVSAPQGKLLGLLAKLVSAQAILEIGTLGGYSTIWMARALAPGGKLISLEIDPAHAQVASANIARAGVSDQVEIRLGPALETLPKLEQEGAGPFDLAFIDADKANNPGYFSWALRLSRPGGLIVVDNVVRGGRVADPYSPDADVQGVRRLHELIAAEPRVSATAIQTVGSKGYDGFTLVLVSA
jgi:predicted O-methyltransferase YrrM